MPRRVRARRPARGRTGCRSGAGPRAGARRSSPARGGARRTGRSRRRAASRPGGRTARRSAPATSAGMPGPSSVTASSTRPPSRQPQSSIRPPSRRVLGRVLEEVLEQPPESSVEPTATSGRSANVVVELVAAEDRPERLQIASTTDATSIGPARRLLAQDAQAGEDRVDHRVEPVDLAERLGLPAAAPLSRRLRGPPRRCSSRLARTTASGVRSSWVTIVTRLARASSMARRLSTWASASAWSRPFSTIPASSAASVSRKRTSARRKTRRLHRLDVEDADDRVVPDERHRAHRRQPRLVEALEPGEAPVAPDVEADLWPPGLRRPAR